MSGQRRAVNRRRFLANSATGALAATAGCVGEIPVVGSALSSCGPGDTRIEDVRAGGYAGETVTVAGELDYTLEVADGGITAFRIDGKTGTIAVFLSGPADRNLDFGDCLTVRGTVRAEDDRPDTDGPVVVDATVL